ncbi:TonB C-terminal domain-containing protein [Magnetospirillum sp. ME-1]|uniref:TonB C-terminal domain-containing protein n=1 Tax=Magnetospirillum sp. ME-1 TaxID=1639348 RepID=UPI000A195CF7|nr:TonB C-terminal domain-containing protein [Magnetospirillum sp. ME-1]
MSAPVYLLVVYLVAGSPIITTTPTPDMQTCKALGEAVKSVKFGSPDHARETTIAGPYQCISPTINETSPLAELQGRQKIRAHIEKFWKVPAIDQNDSDISVMIKVSVLPDGTVASADIAFDPEMAKNGSYGIVADSARRAVRAASPLPIPREKYEQYRDFTLNFNPRRQSNGAEAPQSSSQPDKRLQQR